MKILKKYWIYLVKVHKYSVKQEINGIYHKFYIMKVNFNKI